MEVKLWWELPDGSATSIVKPGADGVLVVAPGWQAAPVLLAIHAVDAATAARSCRLGCRQLDPGTGEALNEDLRPCAVD